MIVATIPLCLRPKIPPKNAIPKTTPVHLVNRIAGLTVRGFATSTDLTFSVNPPSYGKPDTLTATSAVGIPTGNVVFYITVPINTQVTVPLDAHGVAT